MRLEGWLSLAAVLVILLGVLLTVFPPRRAGHRVAWIVAFVLLGGMTFFLTKALGGKTAETRARDRADAKKVEDGLRTRIDSLERQNGELRKGNDQLLSQKAALQERIETELPRPRKLTREQAETLVGALRSHISPVIIRHAKTFESQEYATQLADALTKAGWIVGVARFAGEQKDAPGVFVIVKDKANPPSGALVLARALRRAGVAVISRADDQNPEPLTLYVGIQSALAKNAGVASPP